MRNIFDCLCLGTTDRRGTSRCGIVLLISAAFFSLVSQSNAQWLKKGDSEIPRPLLDSAPFDLIYLNENGENAILKAEARKEPFPAKMPEQGMFQFNYFDGERLQVPYSSIKVYKSYHLLLIDEANQFLRAKQYGLAFRNLLYVFDRGGNTNSALVNALRRCQLEDAAQSFREERFEFSLTIFEDLYLKDPSLKISGIDLSLIEIILKCHGGIIQKDFDSDNFRAARIKIDALEAKYGPEASEVTANWNKVFDQKVNELKTESLEQAAAGQGRQAHLLSRQAEQLAPKDPEIKKIQAKILAQFPLIVVGTSQPSAESDPLRMDHWGSRRVGRLVRRTLVELEGAAEDGGRYRFLNGTLKQIDEMGLRFAFDVDEEPSSGVPQASPFQVATRLLAAANPESSSHNPAWQKILSSVQIDEGRVIVNLRVGYVKPEALMRVPYQEAVVARDGEGGTGKEIQNAGEDGLYITAERGDRVTTYERNPRYPTSEDRHPGIIEQEYRSASSAADDLIKGNIDVVDRISPADFERLKTTEGIVVRPYSIPTVHVLVPRIRGDLKENSFFKSGLNHAIDRSTLIKEAITNGKDISGCEVISGPFPLGIEENEQISYAYDNRVRPPLFNLKMAKVLIDVGLSLDAKQKADKETKLKEEKEKSAKKAVSQAAKMTEKSLGDLDEAEKEQAGGEKISNESDPQEKIPNESAPKDSDPAAKTEAAKAEADKERISIKSPPPQLILAHPTSSTAAAAAGAIARTWGQAGVPTTLRPLDPNQSVPPDDNWDVLYVEAAMEEPLTDVMRLIGRDGIQDEVTAVVDQSLQQLSYAGSWRVASNALRRLHRQISTDLTVIPLFQVKEHYAYRNTVTGVGRSLVHLYQNVDRWKIDVFGQDEEDNR